MDWSKLLSERRIRFLLKEDPVIEAAPEFRGEIEKDYGRAVFCTPVKRLQDKAQVFPLEPIDAVRTRLTHSIEVSSVARSLCRTVARRLEKDGKVTREQADNIEIIGATCGLLHDIGNPPFGHSGEDAIRAWFKERLPKKEKPEDPRPISIFGPADVDWRLENDILNYEGNAQTIRLVSRLQVFSDRRGINLTSAVFSALCKYTADSLSIDPGVVHLKKLGHYNTEKYIVELVQNETGTGRARHPLAYLVEASDDICYLLGDIEDAVKKDVIRWDDVVVALGQMGGAFIEKTKVFMERCQSLHSGRALDENAAQHFRVGAMRAFVLAVADAFIKQYDSIMDGSYNGELIKECDYRDLLKSLKEFSKKRVYTSKETLRLEVLGYRVIRDLLDAFSGAQSDKEAFTLEGKLYRLISHNYRSVFEARESWEADLPDEYRRLMLITDYICGMTDTFALRLHTQLTQGV